MDKIEHSHLDVRGLSLHVAHIGKAELGTVVFLHGFPEIWYSWRHQMLAAAEAGFKAIAPDIRGYGLSGQPSEPEATTWDDIIDDLLVILDLLSIPKVQFSVAFWLLDIYAGIQMTAMLMLLNQKAFVIGKDFGAFSAFDLAAHHSDRVQGVITLGVPHPGKSLSWDTLPEGFYIKRWREPGRAEADFNRFDIKRVVRTIYILFSRSEIPVAEEGQEILDLADLSTPLPGWFTEQDLNAYAALYENSGFRSPLHMPYRSLHKITDRKVEVPSLLIMGEKDYVFKFPGMEEYVTSGMVKRLVPELDIVYVPEGSHFVQEQFPEKINKLIINFVNNHI